MLKKISSFFLILFFFILPFTSYAQLLDTRTNLEINKQAGALSASAGFDPSTGSNSISETVATLIKTFLGFLGIIFIVLVVWAGYNWMTAAGNEEKVSKATTTLYRAVIGLIITLSAYAITYFVFRTLGEAT